MVDDRRQDFAEIARALDGRIAQLAPELLPSGRRNGNYWSAGSVDNEPGGSLYIHTSGPKRGRWTDEATGEFGDALDLVAACRYRGDRKAAYDWSRAWLGLGDGAPVAQATRPLPKARDARDGEADADVLKRRRAAQALWLDAQATIAGTPVEAYLAGRGIRLASLGRQPRALRYHPRLFHRPSGRNMPAMVAAISNIDGDHIATHRTWIEQDQRGTWRKANVENAKMTLGDYVGGSIRIWRGASGKPLRQAKDDEVVVIGEGIETCLSIAIAVRELRILAAVSLGGLGAIGLPATIRDVILAVDNDSNDKARQACQRSIERHMDAGRIVRIARSPIGNDFNDALRMLLRS